jgi:hypothetical protein
MRTARKPREVFPDLRGNDGLLHAAQQRPGLRKRQAQFLWS